MKWFIDYAAKKCAPTAVIQCLDALPMSSWPEHIGVWSIFRNKPEAVQILEYLDSKGRKLTPLELRNVSGDTKIDCKEIVDYLRKQFCFPDGDVLILKPSEEK